MGKLNSKHIMTVSVKSFKSLVLGWAVLGSGLNPSTYIFAYGGKKKKKHSKERNRWCSSTAAAAAQGHAARRPAGGWPDPRQATPRRGNSAAGLTYFTSVI